MLLVHARIGELEKLQERAEKWKSEFKQEAELASLRRAVKFGAPPASLVEEVRVSRRAAKGGAAAATPAAAVGRASPLLSMALSDVKLERARASHKRARHEEPRAPPAAVARASAAGPAPAIPPRKKRSRGHRGGRRQQERSGGPDISQI